MGLRLCKPLIVLRAMSMQRQVTGWLWQMRRRNTGHSFAHSGLYEMLTDMGYASQQIDLCNMAHRGYLPADAARFQQQC
jgi:hypothetical protein